MANLYVTNPNYNPLDPRSLRYVTDTDAQTQAQKKAQGMNELFAPFTQLLGGLIKPADASHFYTPLPQNATIAAPQKTQTGFTSAQGTPQPLGVPNMVNNLIPPAQTGAPAAGSSQIQLPANNAGGGTITVKAGDTLSAIAARNGTTVAALAAANGIANPDRITIGQVLKLGGAPAGGGNAGAGQGGGTGGAPAVPVAPTGKLNPEEIAALAKQAGEAGMSTDQFIEILKANSGSSSSQVDELRAKLGIPNLVDETFKQPTKSTLDTYKELYDMAGLRDIQSKISEVDASINKKRADLVTATGELNSNPWISQATRQGRLKNLQELAYADINNDIERKNQYLDVYDKGVSEIERQIGFVSADRKEQQGLNVDKLNYLLNEAERQQTASENDSLTAGLRNVPDFLKGALSREATQQARELEKIQAQKVKSGGGGSGAGILELLGLSNIDPSSPEAIIADSAGGKATTDSFRTSYEKTVNTLAQLSDLTKAYNTYKTNTGKTGIFGFGADADLTAPIMGIIRSANPYDTKAQQIKAQLTAIVPNLARGVYGEVGVLTDQDVALYQQTLPNLKSTKEVRDALLAITAKSVYRAAENKLLIQAKGGVDVSGFTGDLKTLRAQVDGMLQSAGMPTESPVQGGISYSKADAEYVKSLGLGN